ncbi:MAG: DUF2905 domain-containing protein [Deltaproteobacteria bacterium]|nr:DUF2905 domain-containing protein [Deltaproteobacteria bacterium]
MASLGKILLVSGLVLAGMGLLLLLFDKVGWVGRLPGDIIVRRKNVTFYFPLATSVLISVVLTLLFWLFRK